MNRMTIILAVVIFCNSYAFAFGFITSLVKLLNNQNIDKESTIVSCLTNPIDGRRIKLYRQLEVLEKKVKSQTPNINKSFWKAVKDIIIAASNILQGYENKLVGPAPIPKTLRKSESSQDVRGVLKSADVHFPVPFWFATPELFHRSTEKLSEGSFAEVFKICKENGERRILKIVPVGDAIPQSRFEQLNFKDMTSEIHVSLALSKLCKGTDYRCPTFPKIYRVCVVQDDFPVEAIKAWKSYQRSSSHPCPSFYSSDQAYITIETESAGMDLDHFEVKNYMIAMSIFKQIAAGIAVAEEKLQFEHRDLHLENILIKKCSEETVEIKMKSRKYSIDTFGVKVSIIDFTYSRMNEGQGAVYLNLEPIYDPNPRSYKKYLDHRYVYARMAEVTLKNWKIFCPRTNILWLKHVLECLLDKMEQQNIKASGKLQKAAKVALVIHNRTCLSYGNAAEFVQEEVL